MSPRALTLSCSLQFRQTEQVKDFALIQKIKSVQIFNQKKAGEKEKNIFSSSLFSIVVLPMVLTCYVQSLKQIKTDTFDYVFSDRVYKFTSEREEDDKAIDSLSSSPSLSFSLSRVSFG